MLAQTKRIAYTCAFLLLIGWSFHEAGSTLYGKWIDLHSDKVNRFGANSWEGRISPLRQFLPHYSVVGYLSEKDLPGGITDIGENLDEMLMTQFFLAPRIIVPGAEHTWVIGNFGDTNVDLKAIESRYGFQTRQKLSYGIYLFERPSP
jgi:hypothetical protein